MNTFAYSKAKKEWDLKKLKPLPKSAKMLFHSTKIYSLFITHKILHHSARSKGKGLIDLK